MTSFRYQVTRRLEFDAAHRVPLHESKCQNLHGHRYCAEITCESMELDSKGFVIDFGKIKELVGDWIDRHWDHTTLFEVADEAMEQMCDVAERWGHKPWFAMTCPPTAENMARVLYSQASLLLVESGIRVVRVRLYETPNCWADWPCANTE